MKNYTDPRALEALLKTVENKPLGELNGDDLHELQKAQETIMDVIEMMRTDSEPHGYDELAMYADYLSKVSLTADKVAAVVMPGQGVAPEAEPQAPHQPTMADVLNAAVGFANLLCGAEEDDDEDDPEDDPEDEAEDAYAEAMIELQDICGESNKLSAAFTSCQLAKTQNITASLYKGEVQGLRARIDALLPKLLGLGLPPHDHPVNI